MNLKSLKELDQYGSAVFQLSFTKLIDEAANNLLKLKDKVNVKSQPLFLAVITATKYGYKREDGVGILPIGCLKPWKVDKKQQKFIKNAYAYSKSFNFTKCSFKGNILDIVTQIKFIKR